jgi:hypothetical protein
MTRFIGPKTDFGFKRLFGQEDSKDILKQFLTDVLELAYPIDDLEYIPSEQLPTLPGERTGVYDIYCVDTVGQRFIVEMQRGWQLYIKDRMRFYVAFPILHQGRKGGNGALNWCRSTVWRSSTLHWITATMPTIIATCAECNCSIQRPNRPSMTN